MRTFELIETVKIFLCNLHHKSLKTVINQNHAPPSQSPLHLKSDDPIAFDTFTSTSIKYLVKRSFVVIFKQHSSINLQEGKKLTPTLIFKREYNHVFITDITLSPSRIYAPIPIQKFGLPSSINLLS